MVFFLFLTFETGIASFLVKTYVPQFKYEIKGDWLSF